MSQKKIGIILSYLNLIMGLVVNIFLTPFLIRSLGDLDYSLYKVIHSFAGPLTMFHLGISTIVTRSIVKCQTLEDYTEKDKRNTIAHALLASVIMSAVVAVAGAVMYHLIPGMYGNTYPEESIEVGQFLFVLYVLATVLHMLTDAFSGCLLGHERFAVSSGIPLLKSVLKVVLLVTLLSCGFGVIAVVTVDLILAAVTFLFTAVYALAVLKEMPKFYFLDMAQMREIMAFGASILLQAVVNQVNNNVDTMILGAYVTEKQIITMYSSALAVYSVYNSLVSALSGVFVPKATRLVTQNASGRELTDFIVHPGRYQAMIAVACICGFALFGRNFITIWIGSQYLDAYWVILMLMIPVTVPLVQNAAIAILDAALKRIYRSVILVVMAVLNVIVSLFLIRSMGFWGAAIGTVASLIVGHGFLMNIYYARAFHIEIGRMFWGIFKGILPAGLLAATLCVPLAIFLPDTMVMFLIKCVAYIAVYAVFLLWFGMNQSEKSNVLGMFGRVLRRRK